MSKSNVIRFPVERVRQFSSFSYSVCDSENFYIELFCEVLRQQRVFDFYERNRRFDYIYHSFFNGDK